MKNLTELVEGHLRENNLIYDERECGKADSSYVVPYSGSNVGMLCSIQVYEDQRRLSISVFSGAKAAAERLPAAYEFAARANSIVAIGAFSVASDGGDVSFDIGASALDIEPTDTWLGSLLCTGLHTYDHYFAAIAGVLYAGMEPAEALARLDGPSEEEVVDSVAKLLGSAGEEEVQPAVGEEQLDEEPDRLEAGEDDDERTNPMIEKTADGNMVIRLPGPPGLTARITAEDFNEVLGEIREQNKTRSRRKKKTDDSA